MQKTSAKEIYRLSPGELVQLGLATAPASAETLIDPKRCANADPPGNCVSRPGVSASG
jgi:hypothetical protein